MENKHDQKPKTLKNVFAEIEAERPASIAEAIKRISAINESVNSFVPMNEQQFHDRLQELEDIKDKLLTYFTDEQRQLYVKTFSSLRDLGRSRGFVMPEDLDYTRPSTNLLKEWLQEIRRVLSTPWINKRK